MHLLKVMLKASGKKGVPQGGVISPLLSNLYLNEVDKMLERAREVTRNGKYPSDLTDEEWALVEPLIAPAKRGGNKRTVEVREVVNGLMYALSTGCQWRAIPKELPPRSTAHDYFDLWAWDGTLDRIHYALYVQCRELAYDLTHTIITTSEGIGHWTKTRRFLARFSGPESSVHTRYLVDFTITTSGIGFRYTQV
jgi:transposase